MQADELAGKDSELALSGDLDEGKNIQPLMIVASSLCDPRPTGTWPCCYCTLKFRSSSKLRKWLRVLLPSCHTGIVICAAYGSSLAAYHHLLPTFCLKRHFADTSFLPATLPRT